MAARGNLRSVADEDDLFVSAIAAMPEAYVECRSMMHAWEITSHFRVVDSGNEESARERGGERVYARRDLTCTRCGMTRTDAFRITSRRGRTALRKLGSTYHPPEGYSIPGVGRGGAGMKDLVYGAQFDHDVVDTPVRGRGRPRRGEA
jgi:hypothetical protein